MRAMWLGLLLAGPAWAVDQDGDGFDAAVDCDDTNPGVNPGMTEIVGSPFDDDCDGVSLCFQDADHDGYGTPTVRGRVGVGCAAVGFSRTSDDCDDTTSLANPGILVDAPGDGLDNDCDGLAACFVDDDGDGYGAMQGVVDVPSPTCAWPGASGRVGDCDDTDPFVSPGAVEIPGDDIDNDCDGRGGRVRVTATAPSCPAGGDGVVAIDRASWQSTVWVVAGPPGSTVVPTGPCAGTVVPVTQTVLRPVLTDEVGAATLWVPGMSPGACGAGIVALDVRTCQVSVLTSWQ